jgi:putative transcriptional regulator
MDESQNFTGKIIAVQPANLEPTFSHGVVLIAQHSLKGAWGVIINKPAKTVNMKNIMTAAGIEYNGIEAIYIGGPVEPTRVHVVHTLDWFSPTTLKITDDLGITGDISVLAAIAAEEGPKMYRAGVGLAVWGAGQLEGEFKGEPPWNPIDRWLCTDATVDLILTGNGEEQYQRAIGQCVAQTVNNFF